MGKNRQVCRIIILQFRRMHPPENMKHSVLQVSADRSAESVAGLEILGSSGEGITEHKSGQTRKRH